MPLNFGNKFSGLLECLKDQIAELEAGHSNAGVSEVTLGVHILLVVLFCCQTVTAYLPVLHITLILWEV